MLLRNSTWTLYWQKSKHRHSLKGVIIGYPPRLLMWIAEQEGKADWVLLFSVLCVFPFLLFYFRDPTTKVRQCINLRTIPWECLEESEKRNCCIKGNYVISFVWHRHLLDTNMHWNLNHKHHKVRVSEDRRGHMLYRLLVPLRQSRNLWYWAL